MRAMPVVPMKPDRQLSGSSCRVVVGAGIGPFAQAGLDEALSLSVGLRRVRLGADVPESEAFAGSAEGVGSVTRTIVGHHALDLDAKPCIIGDRGFEEGDGASFALVRSD